MKKQRKSSNFRGKVSQDAKRQAKRGSSYLDIPKDVKVLTIEDDTRLIHLDFLPYEVTDEKHPDRNDKSKIAMPGALWYKRPFRTHRNVGVNNETIICLKSISKKCPICEWVREKMDKGGDWDDVKEIASKPRNLYIVVPVDSKDYDEVPHVWDMSHFLFQEILNEELEINEENDVFPDLEEGKTAIIKLKWEKFGRSPYPKARDIKFEDRDPYDEKILDEVPNLDELLNVLSYEEIKNKFFEMDDEEVDNRATDEDDDEKEERVTRERKPKPTRGKKEPESEDNDDDKQEPEEKDKPRRTSTSRSSSRSRRKDKADDDNPCPHDHKFGTDWDDKDECADCKKYDECMDEYGKQNK